MQRYVVGQNNNSESESLKRSLINKRNKIRFISDKIKKKNNNYQGALFQTRLSFRRVAYTDHGSMAYYYAAKQLSFFS